MLIGTERLKPCPSCNSENVYLQPGHDGWVHCNECAITAPEEVWESPRKLVEELQSRIKRMSEVMELFTYEWSEDDREIPEDEDIKQIHPLNTDDFETYMKAVQMVSAKRSKYALVNLVNYLLAGIKEARKGECQENLKTK